MNYPKVILMVDSASRPHLFKQAIDSIIKHLKYSGQIEWKLHEAVLYKDKSSEIIHWAKYSNLFKDIVIENNPNGQGWSISNILDITHDRYFIHWEDDCVAIRDIPLDRAVRAMIEGNNINQITFHKRGIFSELYSWKKKIIDVNGVKLTTSPHFRYMSALWDLSFVKKYWERFIGHNSHWDFNNKLNRIFDRNVSNDSADWIIKNTGVYYLDSWECPGEGHYVDNIGANQSNRNKTPLGGLG